MQGQPPPYTSGPQPQMHVMHPHPQVVHAPGTTIIHTNMPGMVPVVVGQQMGPNPASMTCKSCHHEIVTRVETKATMRTHLFALMLCILGYVDFYVLDYFKKTYLPVSGWCYTDAVSKHCSQFSYKIR